MALAGCQKDENPKSFRISDSDKKTLVYSETDKSEENGREGTCNCYYQILSVNATPFVTSNPSGGPNYYLYGGVYISEPPIEEIPGCSNTFDDCTGYTCYDFSAHGSVSPTGCWCFDPDCTDFIYDDQNPLNGSPYSTQLYPFKCSTPYFSDLKAVWEAGWNNSTCTNSSNWCAPGSTLVFRIICVDPPELFDCQNGQTQGNAVQDTFTVTLANPIPSRYFRLEGCGCDIVRVL